MGAPSSSLIAEIFLQHIENTHLAHLSKKHYLLNIVVFDFTLYTFVLTHNGDATP